MDSENYEEKLKILQYDILFGKQYIYEEKNPYQKSDLQIGLNQPRITKVYVENDILKVEGQNFTHASKIFVNGKKIQTIVHNSNLITSEEIPKNLKQIKVGQISLYDKVLSYSEEYYME